MFLFHMAFSLALISLTAGLFLFVWSVRIKDGFGAGLAKLLGAIIVILAVGNLICICYTGAKLKQEGYFHYPVAIANIGTQNPMATDKAKMVEKTKQKEKTKTQ